MAIAFVLTLVGAFSYQARREYRIARIRENSEIAYRSAEAGFSWVRARLLMTGGGDVTGMQGESRQLQHLDRDEGTTTMGTYTIIEVTSLAPQQYYVRVKGEYGQGETYALHYVSGTLAFDGTSVATTYDP